MSNFAELGLNATLQANVEDQGYKQPTDIQTKSIAAILSGADTYSIAPTGTGKTAAYLLPILQQLSQTDHSSEQVRPIRALILVPTRELAAQVEESISAYGKDLKLRTIMVCGGSRIESQTKRFKRGTDILVATPKRLIDLLKIKTFSLKNIRHFVMDESDRLVSMGITRDLKTILAALAKEKQTILFSATESNALSKFSQENQQQRKYVKANDSQPALDKIIHTMYSCYREEKDKQLVKLLDILNCDRALIFTRTKQDVNRLNERLIEQGLSSQGIHNEISQRKRQERLSGFKNKDFNFLVATDIASRGIDVEDLYYVINYDLPVNANDYIHRAGRTARTGANKNIAANEAAKKSPKANKPVAPWAKKPALKKRSIDILGHVFSLVSPEQERLISKIANAVGKEIKLERFPNIR